MAQNKYLDLTGLQTYDEKIKELITTKDGVVLEDAKEYADSLSTNYDPAGTAATKVQELADGQVAKNKADIEKLNGSDTTEGSVAKQVKDAKDAVEAKIGDVSTLETTAKDNVVAALNEVKSMIGDTGEAGKVTIDTSTTTSGMSKSYTIMQNNVPVGTIDIPKDMFAKSGVVEKDPEGQPAGTYLVITLANATEDKVYINVGTLIDIYKAKQSATQVQIAIDSATREISATIVAGSITDVELAANAVTTVKIADGNVTKAKLATTVQASLDKADSALQKANITSGTANGTIAVGGTDVAVKGLGSAAYTDSTAYATAEQGAKADSAVQSVVSGTANGTIAVDGKDVAVKGLASAAYKAAGSAVGNVPVNGAALGTTTNVPVVTNASGQLVPHASGALKSAAFKDSTEFDAAGTAQTKVTELANGQVTTNKNDISGLKGRVDTLEANPHAAITEQEILALFTA